MPLELQEVDDLIDADRDPVAKETIEAAIQAMLFHQVIYDDTPGVPKDVVAALRRHRVFFEKYFSAAGYRLRIEAREQMIALESHSRAYGWRMTRLRKDETLVRLGLRFLLGKGLETGAMDETMRVPSDTDEIVDIFRMLAPQSDPPAEARLTEILHDLHRLGAVRVGDRDRSERVTSVLLLPGLLVHVPDVYIERVILWVEQGCPGGDVFDFLAERKREDDARAVDGTGSAADSGAVDNDNEEDTLLLASGDER